MSRSTLDKIRESLRLQQVYNVFMRYGMDILLERWDTLALFRRRMQAWVWQLPPEALEPVSLPVKVRLMIEELGPTYVKMGQIVSSQDSVIPPDWAAELEKLQSDVPPFPSDQVRQILIEELKEPPERLFGSFEPVPFAAASTAQVHSATLSDGTAVAVKVQRPNIYHQMKADIGIMSNAVQVISRRSEYVKSIDLAGMVEQFGTSVLDELDYTGEAYNALRLADSMSSLPGVGTPRIYPELSTSKVLTMAFVHGVKVTDLAAIDAAGLDRSELARNTLRAIVKQLLIDGFFHADPHPGNVLVDLHSGAVTFLDTGMVGELDLQQRLNVVQLMLAVQQGDVAGMAQILKNMSTPFVAEVDEKAYYRDFRRRVGRYTYAGTGLPFDQAISVAFDLLRKHGLRLDPNLTLAVKALLQAQAIATALYPEGDTLAEGLQMVSDLAFESITADRLMAEAGKQLAMSAREVIKRVPSLSDATVHWLDQYQKGRFEVTVDTSDFAQHVERLAWFGRQVVIALMLVGMLIGSAIAAGAIAVLQPTGRAWDLVTTLTYGGYVFAMIIAAVVVIRLTWRWLRGQPSSKD